MGVVSSPSRKARAIASVLSSVMPAFQRALSGQLDGRAIGHRVGEGQAQLDDVDARAGQALHHLERGLVIRIARHHIGDEGLLPSAFSRRTWRRCGSWAGPSLLKRGFAPNVPEIKTAGAIRQDRVGGGHRACTTAVAPRPGRLEAAGWKGGRNMGFKMGIVGLPNVGKSTLFNALTRTAAAQAANFPFCTIEPNVGDVAVPDARLDKLAAIAKSKQVIPTRMTFVDIAGLVKGASKGEGLGNQFLANIREVDAIAHVLRCFEDGDVTHVEGRVDPVADAEVIETELMLADLESIEKRLQNIVRKVRGGDKEAVQQERLLKAAKAMLEEGKPARWSRSMPRRRQGLEACCSF
jgi:hypothetical protein